MKKSGKEDPGCEKPGRNYRERVVPYQILLLFLERGRAEGAGKRRALVMGHIFLRNPFLALRQTKI